jgi:hypothetical protein
MIGGKSVENEAKARPKEMGIDESNAIIRMERNKKPADSTFFRVSDANTQAIINRALEGLKFGGKISKEHAERINDILLRAVVCVIGFHRIGAHFLSRKHKGINDGHRIEAFI